MLAFKSMVGLVLEGVAAASRISGESRTRRILRLCSDESESPGCEIRSMACCSNSSRWSVVGEVIVNRTLSGFPMGDEVEGKARWVDPDAGRVGTLRALDISDGGPWLTIRG